MSFQEIVKEISHNIYLLKLVEKDTKYFEALWEIPEGVTYNAYLVKTEDEAVLIDGWKSKYSEEFIDTLESLVDIHKIGYLIVNHMEPDHSGSLPAILEKNKNIVVLGHPMVRSLINSFYGLEVNFKAVKDQEVLNVRGEEFKFIHTPGVHWPDNIMTYMKRGILFSSDAFGSYSAIEKVFDYELSDDDFKNYVENAIKYFATVVGHYREFAFRAIKKIEDLNLNIKMIAPSHGLILKDKIPEFIDLYKFLGSGNPLNNEIAVVYSSMYGFLDKIIKKTINVLEREGLKYYVARFTDTERNMISEIIGKIYASQAIILGVSTYETEAFPLMMYLIDLIKRKIPPKPVVVISDYGWSGGAAKLVRESLEKAGFEIVDIVRIKGLLSKEGEAEIEKAIENLTSKL